jgi:hypothetical protein
VAGAWVRFVPKKRPKLQYVWLGWICGLETDRAALERMGIKVGRWSSGDYTFRDCVVEQRSLALLKVLWKGKWLWGLIAKKREEVEAPKPEDDPSIPF